MDRYFGGVFHPNDPNSGYVSPMAQQQMQQPSTPAIDIQGLIDRLTKQLEKANTANQQRYDQLLKNAANFGQTARNDNADATAQQMAQAQSSLISRGLGNSTIVDSVQGGIQRQGQRRLTDINERVLQQQNGIIERRTDQAPNLGMYAQLLMNRGARGGY